MSINAQGGLFVAVVINGAAVLLDGDLPADACFFDPLDVIRECLEVIAASVAFALGSWFLYAHRLSGWLSWLAFSYSLPASKAALTRSSTVGMDESGLRNLVPSVLQ
jgi:hypothetical protein